MPSVTHVAGPVAVIEGRQIQRCVVCGDKLCDSRGAMMPVNPDGSAPTFPTWEQGALVQCEGSRQSVVGSFFDEGPLPDDFCLVLVE